MALGGSVTELSKLAAATGASADKLSIIGNSLNNVSIGQFNVENLLGLSISPANVGYKQTFTAEMLFASASARFDRIKDLSVNPNANPTNFTWLIASSLATTVNRGFLRVLRNDYFVNATSCSQSLPVTVSAKFYDQGFNDHIPNYNVFLSNVVTLFSPPRPAIAASSGTRPPQPCDPACASCSGATYTVTVDHGSYGGVNGTSSDLYLNGVLQGTTTTGVFTYTGLCGNTGYSAYSINNFGCQSFTITFTTPAYI